MKYQNTNSKNRYLISIVKCCGDQPVLIRNILELAGYHLYLAIDILTQWKLLGHPKYYGGNKS